MASVKDHYPEDQPLRERFLHIGRELVKYFLASPREFRFVEQFHNSPFGAACRQDKLLGKTENDIVVGLFEEGRQQQLIKDLPLSILFALSFGPLLDVCRDRIFQFIELDDALIARIVEACWDAVKR
jgi:hypothetical protein